MDTLEKVSVPAAETRNPPTPTQGGGCRDGVEWDEVLKQAYSSVNQGIRFPRASSFPERPVSQGGYGQQSFRCHAWWFVSTLSSREPLATHRYWTLEMWFL